MPDSMKMRREELQEITFYRFLFHFLTRTAYVYNGRLPWYNVVLTSRVH